MAAAIPRTESQHEVMVQPLWQRPVPAGDPLAVPEKKAEIGAISGDRVVVPYLASLANGRGRDQWRATALDMKTGRTLWDVDLSADVSGPSKVVASDRHVFFAVWNSLVVLDLATGEHRATIGGW
jgi:outer membrane protein assembly factor BamB